MDLQAFGDSLIQIASEFYGKSVTIAIVPPDHEYPTYAATFVTLDGYKLPRESTNALCRGEGRTLEEAVKALGADFTAMLLMGFSELAKQKGVYPAKDEPKINVSIKPANYSVN